MLLKAIILSSQAVLPWLQFSSSLWSMQSNTSSQRQRRGIQWARFRHRNSSSLHSFTQPTCPQRHNHQTAIRRRKKKYTVVWTYRSLICELALWWGGSHFKNALLCNMLLFLWNMWLCWPHLNRQGSCHVRHTAGWLTHSLRSRTHTHSQSKRGQLEKRNVLEHFTFYTCSFVMHQEIACEHFLFSKQLRCFKLM